MERRAITVMGTVQGVGFRPHVHALASRLGLGGRVTNRSGDVLIEVEGEPPLLDRFLAELTSGLPRLARIEAVCWRSRPPRGDAGFRIEESEAAGGAEVFVPPDVATCPDCLAELFDPADRRYRYPFLNCTNCGPRLTVITAMPYDRDRTTLAAFALCPECRREYDSPGDRRFHAQPTACPRCGPRLQVRDRTGCPVPVDDAVRCTAAALRDGQIVALKGLGGYHLACDATHAETVGELRKRKGRDQRPFAVMLSSIAAAESLCEMTCRERERLLAPESPIVLLRRRADAAIVDAVAPGCPWLGVMLPYTPLHHLLMRELDGLPLVMTSGNRTDEPIACDDADAVDRLAGIADVFLTHDRPIQLRCDDTVTRIVAERELPIRRSRGYAPRPIDLPVDCTRPMLALGGQQKVTFALGRDRHAFLSHHIGDLDDYRTLRAYDEAVRHYERLLQVRPQLLVHDLHPDYASTEWARRRAEQDSLPRLAVQHHHAHMASCMAEHGLNEPVIGVTFDGTGFGTDGTVWGGEFLIGDVRQFRRAACLRPLPMPGGEQAVREPWRMAASCLIDAGLDCRLLAGRVSAPELRTVETMIHRRINAPLTSSAGRLFDAVASLVGLRDRVSYEGQAAVELEWLAWKRPAGNNTYPFDYGPGSGLQNSVFPVHGPECRRVVEPAKLNSEDLTPTRSVDVRPLVRAVVQDMCDGVPSETIAWRFHGTLAEIIVQVCRRLRAETGLDCIVLSGGVFANVLLLESAERGLTEARFRVFRHERVPPNDGGLCLGQLAIAAAAFP